MRNRLIITIVLLTVTVEIKTFAQEFHCDSILIEANTLISNHEYDKSFNILREGFIKASFSKKKNNIDKLSLALDSFLSNVSFIPIQSGVLHNEIPALWCKYKDTVANVAAFLNGSTLLVNKNGKLYMDSCLHDEFSLSLFHENDGMNSQNKYAKKVETDLIKKHTKQFSIKEIYNRSTVFFVKEEGLYYAAIPSKEIPPFEILSTNNILNFASCIKVILQSSRIESDYNDIIHNFLHSSINAHNISAIHYGDSIAQIKVSITKNSNKDRYAQIITDNLCNGRYLIAMNGSGSPLLVTAIAFDEHNSPTYIRYRSPSMETKMQFIQGSWDEFQKDISLLFEISIYK